MLDTLKKFADLMNKSDQRKFGKVIRKFSAVGGTVIALAHTNKNRDTDGKLVPTGTADIKEDVDCTYIIDILSKKNNICTIELENGKNRGVVAKKAIYQYSIAEGLSYKKLLKSVVEIDPKNLDQLRNDIDFEASGDKALIELVKGFIAQGINTKTTLVNELVKQGGITKNRARKFIEKYTGDDPIKHNWKYKVGKRGKHKYSVLPLCSPD